MTQIKEGNYKKGGINPPPTTKRPNVTPKGRNSKMKGTIECYKIGSKVYALSRYYKDNEPSDHVAIYEAYVEDIVVSKKDGLKYWLSTPEGEKWGDSCSEHEVHHDIDVLLDKMKLEWDKNKNIH